MEQSLGVRVPSLAALRRGWDALLLAAVFKEKHLGGAIAKVETNRAVAADQIAGDAATGPHAVDLVNAHVRADIKLAPHFDKDRSLRIAGEQKFQGRALVFDVNDRRCCFDCVIIQADSLEQTGHRQFAPGRCDAAHAHPGIEPGGGVLPRMSAQCDPDRFAGADTDRDPEMIDVRREAIDFRRERDRTADNVNEVPVVESKVAARGLLSASMWQAF